MIVISESEIGIPCDSGRCTNDAEYMVTLRLDQPLVRLYCKQCTGYLVNGAAKVLAANNSDESLHDYIETELLKTGRTINA